MEFHRIHNAIELFGPPKSAEAKTAESAGATNGNAATEEHPAPGANGNASVAPESLHAKAPLEVQAGGVLPARPAMVPRSALFEAVSSAVAESDPIPLHGFGEPKLAIGWGEFHQGVASSIGALLRRPFGRGPRGE